MTRNKTEKRVIRKRDFTRVNTDLPFEDAVRKLLDTPPLPKTRPAQVPKPDKDA